MPLCFIEPQEAIRVMAESIGREARRQLLGEVVRAWVDEIPDDELEAHYAKAIDELDDDDLSMLAAWHASMEVGAPVANKEFLMKAFPGLGVHRREALRIAAGFRGDEAFEAGVSEEQALDTVLPWLSAERAQELAAEAVELYCWDRLGSDNWSCSPASPPGAPGSPMNRPRAIVLAPRSRSTRMATRCGCPGSGRSG
jgi:hypothetical protein